MDESSARRVVLARAIEEADGKVRLLTPAERDQIDRQARLDAIQQTRSDEAIDPERYLLGRADRVIAAVGLRHPALVALLEPGPWASRVATLLPLLALVAGAATDLTGNPHRVDLISLPVLGLVAWNLVVYVFVALGALRRKGPKRSWLSGVGTWADGEAAMRRRGADSVTQARALFHRYWLQARGAMEAARWTRVLHLGAAAWATGLLLSLLVRGLVVEYRVGWESTFLGPAEVHALLNVLRWPASLLFPFPPVSVDEVAALRFSAGGGEAAGGRHWVAMVVALMTIVVIIPRLALAAWARANEFLLRRDFRFDVEEPYFARIASLLASARVTLSLAGTGEDAAQWLRQALAVDPHLWPVIGTSEQGDVLRIALHVQEAPEVVPPRWLWQGPRQVPKAQSPDAVLCVPALREHVDAAVEAAVALGRPLLLVVRDELPAMVGGAAVARVLRAADFARCWVQERVFYDAVAGMLEGPRRESVERIAVAKRQEQFDRLRRSMTAAADHLLFAARQQDEMYGLPSGVGKFLPSNRDAITDAQQRAMDGVLARVRASGAQYLERLGQAYGVPPQEAAQAEQHLEAHFHVTGPIHASQAGVAGAATGAAMGASVDLVTGGLTLGAAAALGALLGGGAAYVGAVWKNRASPTGATLVQLSDAMMLALVEASLLRYLAVIHTRSNGKADTKDWPEAVASAVRRRSAMVAPFWTEARTHPNPVRLAQPLAHELETAIREVLEAIYPGLPKGPNG